LISGVQLTGGLIGSLIVCIFAGVAVVLAGTELSASRGFWDPFWSILRLIAGTLLGVLIWVMLAPRTRVRRAAILLVTINCLAWVMYLAFTPRVPGSEFDQIARDRAALDGHGSVDLIHDGPSVLAGRESGFWPVNHAHRFLILMSGEAIMFAETCVMPAKYLMTRPTRAESYRIAAIGFVLSTAWWTTVGTAIPWIHQVLQRRRRKRL
jgi:hypothetical protein